MIGVENQRDIEGVLDVRLRHRARRHIEEVRRQGEAAAWREGLLAVAQPVEHGHHRRELRDEPHRLRYSPAAELSVRSGSPNTAALTAVRSTFMGFAPSGASLITPCTTLSTFWAAFTCPTNSFS